MFPAWIIFEPYNTRKPLASHRHDVIMAGLYSLITATLGKGLIVALKDIREHLMEHEPDARAGRIVRHVLQEANLVPQNVCVADVCKRFLFLSLEDSDVAANDPTKMVTINCQPASFSASEYKELLVLAKALTCKLRFLPAIYTAAATFHHIPKIDVVQEPAKSIEARASLPKLFENIPRDVTLKTAAGETLEYNKDIHPHVLRSRRDTVGRPMR